MVRPASLPRRQQRLQALAKSHRAWIRFWAKRYAQGRPDCLEDLEQVGQIGLLSAFDRYDARRGVPFTAYARHHIRGAMRHYLRDQWPLIRIPRVQQERLAALFNCQQRLGQPLKAEQLRDELNLTTEQWDQLERARLSSRRVGLDPRELEDWAASTPALELQDSDQASRWLSWLDPREAEVLRLVVLEGLSLRTAAAQLRVSASSVRRQLQAGLAELRRRLSPASDVAGC